MFILCLFLCRTGVICDQQRLHYQMKEIDFTGQSYSIIPDVEMLENPCYIYKLFEVHVCRRKNRRKMPIPYQIVTHFMLA